MPIGKNSIKRVKNNGYSAVQTSAPDMENSTVIASPAPEVIEMLAPSAKKTAAKPKKTTSTATKRTTAAKKSGKKVSAPKAPVAPAPSAPTAPVAKDAAGVEEKSYVNLGGTPLPVHLLFSAKVLL